MAKIKHQHPEKGTKWAATVADDGRVAAWTADPDQAADVPHDVAKRSLDSHRAAGGTHLAVIGPDGETLATAADVEAGSMVSDPCAGLRVEIEELKDDRQRIGKANSDLQYALDAEHAEVESLRAENEKLRADLKAAEELKAESTAA